ncbi:MAG TPA: anti-sigma factor [Povalibacter sp.]|nr:anti-sigma factor [Povalibacter sp.]
MNYGRPELLEELAGQYVLGTLRGAARRRFERYYRSDPAALQAVQRWEDRLLDLTVAVTPIQPSDLVWQRIRSRVRGERRTSGITRLALAASIAALAVAIGWWNLLGPGSSQLVATVADQQHTEVWRIEAPRSRQELRVDATGRFAFDSTRSYELWALPGPGVAPVSLGLMPQGGRGTLRLTEAQRLALAQSKQVAVSLEPPGGSPTGAPTGPILFVADVSA